MWPLRIGFLQVVVETSLLQGVYARVSCATICLIDWRLGGASPRTLDRALAARANLPEIAAVGCISDCAQFEILPSFVKNLAVSQPSTRAARKSPTPIPNSSTALRAARGLLSKRLNNASNAQSSASPTPSRKKLLLMR